MSCGGELDTGVYIPNWGVRDRWLSVQAGSRLAFLFVSLLLLIFIVFFPLEFLASEFLDDDVLLTGRESRVR